jgi:TFIIF-interacting CTD phosphatase-like protein
MTSKVEIDRHPVRFYVYKRPHVDYFLSIVSSILFKYSLFGFKYGWMF